jgi:FixJ family two-component response regulator
VPVVRALSNRGVAIQRTAKLVAIVDDDDSVRNALKGLMEAAGLEARAFASAEEFLNAGVLHETTCLITDIRMSGMSGLELQQTLNASNSRIPVIFVTAHGDARMRSQALQQGAVEFLIKPFDDEILLGHVRRALNC